MRGLAHAAVLGVLSGLASCDGESRSAERTYPPRQHAPRGVELLVLGTAQDAGAPQIACRRACCERLRAAGEREAVASLAILDHEAGQVFLIDASPDFRDQLDHPALVPHLKAGRRPLDGILLTHAHIGHYLGLAFLGRESMAADAVPVHATPRMAAYLKKDGPWSLLASEAHITLIENPPGATCLERESLSIRSFTVPHRDEYSDTVGYELSGPTRTAIYLPDVDRIDDPLWSQLMSIDVLFLDGTFWDDDELEGRDMSSIPHPRIAQVLKRWSEEPTKSRPELHFVHLNHTNPALDPSSAEARAVEAAGAHIARPGLVIHL